MQSLDGITQFRLQKPAHIVFITVIAHQITAPDQHVTLVAHLLPKWLKHRRIATVIEMLKNKKIKKTSRYLSDITQYTHQKICVKCVLLNVIGTLVLRKKERKVWDSKSRFLGTLNNTIKVQSSCIENGDRTYVLRARTVSEERVVVVLVPLAEGKEVLLRAAPTIFSFVRDNVYIL